MTKDIEKTDKSLGDEQAKCKIQIAVAPVLLAQLLAIAAVKRTSILTEAAVKLTQVFFTDAFQEEVRVAEAFLRKNGPDCLSVKMRKKYDEGQLPSLAAIFNSPD